MSANFERELRKQAREDLIVMVLIAAVSFGFGALSAVLMGAMA